jgi:hypothetical protein
MPSVVAAEGAILERILDTAHAVLHQDLSRHAVKILDAAQRKTAWALGHQRRFALVEGADVLASALRYDLTGTLDQQHVRICAIGGVSTELARHSGSDARVLVDRLVDGARQDGTDIALLFVTTDGPSYVPDGFEVIPTVDVELRVAESSRRGAPMALVRGGEDRDLSAIAAMGQARASQFRFHLDRDVDLVKHAITKKRLLAGLGAAGVRQLEFVVAEEGITAAAYLVVSVVDNTWTIEECGDRDPSGARVGAILQALIAREPMERRPIIRGWLPHGFVPPQITIVSARPATEVMLGRFLRGPGRPTRLLRHEVLYWRSDVF